MELFRPPFRSPILCIDDFLLEEEAQKVLQECIDLKKVYMPASIFDGPRTVKLDQKYRYNDVVYLDEIFRSCPERSDILTIIKKKIWTEECKMIWHDGYYIFDIINYATWHEAVISRYGKSGFYHKHQDTRRDHITYRLVTLIYYVNRTPEGFEGGALTVWHDDDHVKIEPKHNRAVVFPSFMLHEVENVHMKSEQWEDGRFSVNYWMGFK
jgi:Rps23 Pro-64 3,4-dihydroxylase Tpa1-like proline 4-hydroxylase